MRNLLWLIGNALGVIGILTCAGTAMARLAGMFYLMGVETQSLFAAGTALMVAACLVKLTGMELEARSR